MKVIVNGAAGYMGGEVLRFVRGGYRNAYLAAAIDRNAAEGMRPGLSEFQGAADVLIDFSHHAAIRLCLNTPKAEGCQPLSERPDTPAMK